MREPERCLAVHTCNPVFSAPVARKQPLLWAKWQLAKLTRAKYTALSFGYLPSELAAPTQEAQSTSNGQPLGPTMHQLFSLRPQTLAYSLCDSPVGLLAVLLDLVATQGPGSILNSRPRSPFLDPGELEMQDRERGGAGHERVRSDETVKAPHAVGAERRTWSPMDILDWTMM